MNCLTKTTVLVPFIALLYGCGDHTDRTLDPPPNAKWVDVVFRVPEGITLLPMEVLYRSERCKTVRYNSSNEPHDIPGYNDLEKPYSQQGSSNTWQARVAIDGGGWCQWQLNSLRVSFKIADNNPLIKGKKVIDTNYIFDFDDYGLSDGYGTGRAKETSGDLELKAEFFPMVINHIDNEVDLSLFGGNTGYEQWRRRYKINNTQKIYIEPQIHFNQVVTLTPPAIRPGDLTATYPDGSSEKIPHIYPDYEKLLSMK